MRSLPGSLQRNFVVVVACSLNRGRLLRHGCSGDWKREMGEDVGREAALAEQWNFVLGCWQREGAIERLHGQDDVTCVKTT